MLIFVVALLVFGPKRLPELARTLGKSLNEFRNASNELRRSIMEPEVASPPKPSPALGAADEMAAAALPANLSPVPAAAAPAPAAPAQPPEEPRPS